MNHKRFNRRQMCRHTRSTLARYWCKSELGKVLRVWLASRDFGMSCHHMLHKTKGVVEKNTSVKHMVATCSIIWHKNQDGKGSRVQKCHETTHCHDMLRTFESLPQYPTSSFNACLLSIGLWTKGSATISFTNVARIWGKSHVVLSSVTKYHRCLLVVNWW